MGACFGSPKKQNDPFDFVLKDKFDFLSVKSLEGSSSAKKKLFSMLPESIKNENPEESYKKIELIGKGSFGSVYRIERLSDKKNFACKVISCSGESKENILHILKEVKKEVEILSLMEGHRNIVRFYGSYYYKTDFWIILEYCEVGSIVDYIELCNESLTEQEMRVIIKSILRAIAYLHSKKIIHRDIKSGNIMITHKGIVKLGDFGVSAQLETKGDYRRSMEGSIYWLSPQVVTYRYNSKADIWSLGITVLEMAEKFPPYWLQKPESVMENIRRNVSPFFKKPENWSDDMKDFLRQCLDKDERRRPSAVQLLRHPIVHSIEDEEKVLLSLVAKMKKLVESTEGGKEELVKGNIRKQKKLEL